MVFFKVQEGDTFLLLAAHSVYVFARVYIHL